MGEFGPGKKKLEFNTFMVSPNDLVLKKWKFKKTKFCRILFGTEWKLLKSNLAEYPSRHSKKKEFNQKLWKHGCISAQNKKKKKHSDRFGISDFWYLWICKYWNHQVNLLIFLFFYLWLIKKNPQIHVELARWKSIVKYAMCQLLHVELGRWLSDKILRYPNYSCLILFWGGAESNAELFGWLN